MKIRYSHPGTRATLDPLAERLRARAVARAAKGRHAGPGGGVLRWRCGARRWLDLPPGRARAGLTMADEVLLAFSTFPDAETARASRDNWSRAEAGGVRKYRRTVESIYHWQGKIEEAQEIVVFFKTTSARWDEFQSTLRSLHPYEVPEIVAVPVVDGPARLSPVGCAKLRTVTSELLRRTFRRRNGAKLAMPNFSAGIGDRRARA